MTISLQFASLYDRQGVFVWSSCLLDLGMGFLVGNMIVLLHHFADSPLRYFIITLFHHFAAAPLLYSPLRCFTTSLLHHYANSPVPAGSPSHGGDVVVCVKDINQPSLPTPFYSVLVSASVFMALSTVFHSVKFS